MKHSFGRAFGRLLAGVLVCAAITGCVRDDLDGSAGFGTGRPGELRIAFSIDGMDEATRAVAAEPHERRLSDVHILFFNQNGGYVTYLHADVPVGSNYFSTPLPQELTPNTAYRTLVIGNAHEHVPPGYTIFDEYLNHIVANGNYETIRLDLYATHHKEGHAAEDVYLPMWGEVQDPYGAADDFQYSGNATDGYQISGSLRFWRSVCRLDLRHDAAKDLIIEKVKLVNFRWGGYYFHQDVVYAPTEQESQAGGFNSELGGFNDGTWVDVSDPFDLSGGDKRQQVRGEIYSFPNMVPIVAQNDKVTTYLMIAGYYQDGVDNTPDNPRQKLTYYRFNMAQNGRSQILRRNHCYMGIINRVSGPGADNESSAEDAKSPLLDYTVSDTWEEDDNTTVTDDKGNFLTVSRAMVSFAGEKELSEIVKVQVKEGLSWSVEWVQNASDAPDHDKFTYLRTDDTSFSIVTKEDNATEFLRKARLTVKATGGNVSTPLTATVDVMQLSQMDEVKVLMVDNSVGTVEYKVPGSGGTLRMQVQTGSMRSTWQAVDMDNSAAAINASWTLSGANGGVLEVDVPANISSGERSFSLQVKRLDINGTADEDTDPVTLVFTQPKSDYLLTVTPQVPGGQEGLSIDGFDPTVTTLKNGLSVQKKFTVNLADPTHYKYCVKSTFNKDYDLFLTKDNPADNTKVVAQWTENTALADTLSGLSHGESFYINVFRTGPGDPTIRGTIKIYAVPEDAEAEGMESQMLAMTVSIKTPCIVGDVLIPADAAQTSYMLVPDRNTGAPMRIQNGKFVSAKNFTNDTNVNISGSDLKDSENKDWKGEYYPWNTGGGKTGAGTATFVSDYWLISDSEGNTNMDEEGAFSPWYKSADADKWKVPSQAELTTISGKLIFSKQRAFLVSEIKDKASGSYIGSYFPLAGIGGDPTAVRGSYWSCTPGNGSSAPRSYAWALSLTATASGLSHFDQTDLYGVRCVRVVSSDEFAAESAQ